MNFAISMKHKEAHTDLWVYELLKEAGLDLDPQGSTIPEVEQALKTASKKGTGKAGRPEFCGAVKDFLIVIDYNDIINNPARCPVQLRNYPREVTHINVTPEAVEYVIEQAD